MNMSLSTVVKITRESKNLEKSHAQRSEVVFPVNKQLLTGKNHRLTTQRQPAVTAVSSESRVEWLDL